MKEDGFSEVVEITARALYAHQHSPGADPMNVPWPPAVAQTRSAYMNRARAVIKAQHDYVRRREANTCTVEIASPTLRAALGNILVTTDEPANTHE